jgi:hypothetical protein
MLYGSTFAGFDRHADRPDPTLERPASERFFPSNSRGLARNLLAIEL